MNRSTHYATNSVVVMQLIWFLAALAVGALLGLVYEHVVAGPAGPAHGRGLGSVESHLEHARGTSAQSPDQHEQEPNAADIRITPQPAVLPTPTEHPPALGPEADGAEYFEMCEWLAVGPNSRRGSRGTELLHTWEYSFGPPTASSASDAGRLMTDWLAGAIEQFTEELLQDRRARAAGDWERDAFQVFGCIASPFLHVVGRDFYVPASPERSLAWYEAALGQGATTQNRNRATALLAGYEIERKQLVHRILARIRERAQSFQPTKDIAFYVIVDHKLVLIPVGLVPELDRSLEAGRAINGRILDKARGLAQ